MWNGLPYNSTRLSKKEVNKDVRMCNKTSRKHSFLDQTSSRRISTSRRRRTCDCATGKEGQFEQGKGHQRDTFRPLLKLFFTLMLWIHKLTLATPMDVVEEYNDHYGSITSINFVKLIVLTLISIRVRLWLLEYY